MFTLYPRRGVPGDQKENKSRVLSHLSFYRKVCLRLTRTDMYTCNAQSFYWLPTSRKKKLIDY
jgi:hypothetical protein